MPPPEGPFAILCPIPVPYFFLVKLFSVWQYHLFIVCHLTRP